MPIETLTLVGTKLDPAKDVIYVKRKRLPKKFPPKVYIALNKPKGSDQRLDYSSMTLYWSAFFEWSSKELIFDGHVTVTYFLSVKNHRPVDPAKDVIYVKGKRLPKKFPPKVYLALNKPKGSDQRLDYSSMTLYWSPFFVCFFFELDFLVNRVPLQMHMLFWRERIQVCVGFIRRLSENLDGLAPGSCAIIVGLGGCHPTYFKAQQRVLLPYQRSSYTVCNCCSISVKRLFGLDQDFNCFAAQFLDRHLLIKLDESVTLVHNVKGHLHHIEKEMSKLGEKHVEKENQGSSRKLLQEDIESRSVLMTNAMGFCLHNNAAIAALAAQATGAKKDAHHENDTQELFDGSTSVCSIYDSRVGDDEYNSRLTMVASCCFSLSYLGGSDVYL
ncbi:hypothetical protein AKJ16_DCAP08490 [Drosera capensis]